MPSVTRKFLNKSLIHDAVGSICGQIKLVDIDMRPAKFCHVTPGHFTLFLSMLIVIIKQGGMYVLPK